MEKIMEKLESYDKAKERLILRPLSIEKVTDDAVYTECGDIALVLYYVVEDDNDLLSSTRIDKGTFGSWGVDEKAAIAAALENTASIWRVCLYNDIGEVAKNKVMGMDDVSSLGMAPMITTSRHTNGAIAMFYPGVQQRISELIGGDYYVAFTSIHEAIIHKVGTINPDGIRKCLREVDELFGSDETLTKEVYVYRGKEELEIV